ncbi:MAG: hypothetical protein WD407_00930 [Rhodospirillales bacterium]
MPIYSERPAARRGRTGFGAVFALFWCLAGFGAPAAADAGLKGAAFGTADAPALLHPVEAIKQPSVGARCVRARKNRGTFQLINRCAICRSVQIQHTRPDNRPPILRDYYLPPNGKIDLPFKGKGRSRVLNDSACEGTTPRPNPPRKRAKPACASVRTRADSFC